MVEINWTDQANGDIDNIVEFLAIQSEKYAKIQIQRIFEKVDLLASMPKLGRVVPELEYEKLRELVVGAYRIVYHIRTLRRVDIITIHHSSRPLDMDKIRPA